MRKKIVLGLLTTVCLVSLAGCGNKLNGTYSGKINLLITKVKVNYVFKDDKVTVEDEDGNVQDKGTYKVDGTDLSIKLNDSSDLATLSKDKKSFEIDGVKFTKND
ncbi:hypothetical protein CF160_11145 [Enterococcus pseudoavium]|nr:hypothetical protein CF160_11145 [Enterococcus pseudoavium]